MYLFVRLRWIALRYVVYVCILRTQINFKKGVHCETNCPTGYYGENCDQVCRCLNNSSCDPDTGRCICSAGWTGADCSEPCPHGFFGVGCRERCPDSTQSECNK